MPADAGYTLVRPLAHGYLNILEGIYSVHKCVDSLEKIITHALVTYLHIPAPNFEHFACVLAIPDLLNKKFVRCLMHLLTRRLRFRSVFLHQESVLATFGAALPYACVVDLGAQKINVCCVDDGTVLPGTLIRKNFGGDDLN